jgi:hypothetical protein
MCCSGLLCGQPAVQLLPFAGIWTRDHMIDSAIRHRSELRYRCANEASPTNMCLYIISSKVIIFEYFRQPYRPTLNVIKLGQCVALVKLSDFAYKVH